MIKINKLEFAYNSKSRVFNAIDIEFREGCIYGLLGRNGSGKSTLLKLISGALIPKGGAIESLNETPHHRNPSYLSQIFYLTDESLASSLTLKQYAKLITPFYPTFNRDQFSELISEFEIDVERPLDKLSLGQHKKCMIAFAIACNTKILLMDEPTNGLDIPSKSQFRKIIARVATENRIVIIATHQVKDIENLIDHITITDQAQILISASIEEIAERLYFGELDRNEAAIYEEKSIGGRVGVRENKDIDNISRVNIELLFNAAITDGKGIKDIFTKK